MDTEILTAAEAAHLLKVAPELVTALLESGALPGRKIADEWRTTGRALAAFIDGAPLGGCCTPGGSCCC